MGLTKAQLEALNISSFPDNTEELITPEILRNYNSASIANTVNQEAYNVDSASFKALINALDPSGSAESLVLLNDFTASQLTINTGYNAFTQSADGRLDSLEATTASLLVETQNLELFSASALTSINALNQFTASQSTASIDNSITNLNQFTSSANGRLNNLETTTASLLIETQNLELFSASALTSISNLNASSASQQVSINALNSATSSYLTETESGSFLLTASFDNGTRNLTFTKGDNTTFNVNIPDVSGSTLPTGVISGSAQITALGFVSSSVTASSLVTASAAGSTITFTKGDNTQFNVTLDTGSATSSPTIFEVVYTGENITKGDPLYISGSQGANPKVFKADAAVPAKMPVTFVANETIGVNNTTNAIVLGLIEGIDLTGYVAGQSIYVAEGGGWSLNLPSGSNSITQLLGVVTKGGSGGKGLVLNPGPAQLPGLDTGYMWVGNGNNQPIEITTASFASSASFNSYTSSNDQKVNSLISATGSYATTGSNAFFGTNTFSGAVSFTGSAPSILSSSFSGSLITNLTDIYTDIPEVKQIVTLTSASYAALFSSSLTDPNTLYVVSGSTSVVTLPEGLLSSSVTNFVDYSASVDSRINGIVTGTGFATTGSNTFSGDQTLVDAAGNSITLSDVSGSLMLVAKGFTSASAHISASSAGIGNFIFKTNSNTPDTIISGSSNIFTNATAPQTGFKRYLSSANISLGGGLPQVSGSMQFSPGINNNYLAGQLTIRGPVSSSAYSIITNNLLSTISIGTSAANHAQGIVSGLTMNTNNINAALNIVANRTNTTQNTSITANQILGATTLNMNSSSILLTGNLIGGVTTITNNTTGSNRVSPLGNASYVAQNIMMGSTTIIASGSNDPNDTTDTDTNANIVRSLIIGNSNLIQLQGGPTGSNSLSATSILGNGLIVTGSSPNPVFNPNVPAIYGSAFVGRFNAVDGNRALSAQTIFAVGTGTSTTRKTGFLIDSGSNTFVEGTFNVSGSTSLNGDLIITGSLTASLQQGYVWVGDSTGKTVTVATSSFGGGGTINTGSFATTGSNSFNGNQTITGSLLVKGNTTFATQDNISSNVILGLDAMINSTGATDSIAIGNNALRYASGSQQNLAFGKNALLISSGSNNFALGNEALSSNTTGNQNVALGIGALSSNTTGNKNLAIGNDAGIQASGSQNVFIGASAGQNITGSNNTIIGSFTGTAGSPLNNNIILADGAGNVRGQYSGSAWSFDGGLNLEKGTDKTTGVVDVGPSGLIVSNSLVTPDSIVIGNIQNAQAAAGGPWILSIGSITTGSFSLNHNYGGFGLKVGYLIINPA
jgi:hypothetical protein